MSRIIFMSSRDLPGAHNDWSHLAKLLGLPADFDHVLILLVFSDSFLQPVLQQPTDLWELKLRWNAAAHALQARDAAAAHVHGRGGLDHSGVHLGSHRQAAALDAEQVSGRACASIRAASPSRCATISSAS